MALAIKDYIIIIFYLEQSVWYHVYNQTYKWSGMRLSKTDLHSLQQTIQKLFRQYQQCSTKENNKRQAICFSRLLKTLEAGKRDVSWLKTTSDEEEGGRAKFGLYLTAYAAMAAHISKLALASSKVYERKDLKAMKNNLDTILKYYLKVLNEYEYEDLLRRLGQLRSVKICEVRTHFWKEFEQVCEFRWRRSSEVDNDIDADIEKFHDDDSALDIADRIGGGVDNSKIRYHGTVIDEAHGNVIFDKYLDTKVETKGQAVQTLFEEGIEARGKEEKKIRKNLEEFHNETVILVRRLINKSLISISEI